MYIKICIPILGSYPRVPVVLIKFVLCQVLRVGDDDVIRALRII